MSLGLLATPTVTICKVAKMVFNVAPGNFYLSQYLEYQEANGTSATVEALAGLAGGTDAAFVTTVLTNLGLADDAGAEAFLTSAVAASGRGAALEAAITALDGVAADDATYGAAKTAFDTATITSVSYSTNTANNSTDATVLANAINAEAVVAGTNLTLSTGVDSLTGTSGNDTYNGAITGSATTATLNAFDAVDAGDGSDTLNIAASASANFAMPASVSFKNFETVNVSQAAGGGTGTGALTVTDKTIADGITSFTYTDASASTEMTAAAVSVTLDDAESVSVSATGTGTFTTVAVTDTSTTASSRGSTLESVTIGKASGAATLHGDGISTLNISKVAGLTTINAASGDRALTINASSTTTQGGVTDATATDVAVNISGAQDIGTVTVAKATEVDITSTAAATAALVAAKATVLNIGGTNLLTLTAGAGNALLETVNVTGSGGVTVDLGSVSTLTTVNTTNSTAADPSSGVKTGDNEITIGTGVIYNGGAGEDKVTVGATSKAVNLGDGADTAIVSVTALATGGSIIGGPGTDVLKLSNANAVTLSSSGTTQTAFKAAVTGFETLDITAMAASTISLSGFGTFTQVNAATAAAAQVLSGAADGLTIQLTDSGTDATSVTTNAITGPDDTVNVVLKGDLSAAVQGFGAIATPGVENMNVTLTDSNSSHTARLATLTITDAALEQLVISGNNGVALTHAGTALYNVDASGLTKGAVTLTAGALTTNATVKGSAAGDDTLNFASALGTVAIEVAGGANGLTGSSTAANTITGGSGIDTMTGGSKADTLVGNAGADIFKGGAGKDTYTGGVGVDHFRVEVKANSASATGANVNHITDFVAGTDKIEMDATTNSTAGDILTGVTLNQATAATAAMSAEIASSTEVDTIAEVYTALGVELTAGEFAASAAAGTANVARVVSFATGDAAGKYLVINDATAAFAAADDIVIEITGISGTISAADFAYV